MLLLLSSLSTEEVTPQQPTCSPSALPLPAQTADASLTCLPTAVGDQLHSSKSASCDQFTNQMENVKDQLLCSGAAQGSNIIESGRDQKSFGAVDEQTTLSSPQFSEFANQVLSKKCPSEQLCVSSNEVQTAPTSVLDDSSKSDCQNNSLNNKLNEKSLLKSTELNTSASKKNEQIKTLAGSVLTTVCDSVPLHNEIAELRRVKRAVEKEAFPLKQKSSGVYKSTLLTGKDSKNSSSVISDVTSDQSNQQGPREVEVPQALESDRPVSAPEYSPNAEFTQQSKLVIDSELEKAEPTESKSQSDDKTACNSSNSPGWRNVIPEQKENNEVQLTENCKASPRSSHCVTKGKPPLPRHVSPVRFTASGFPSIEKGPRSKSVGDVDRSAPESITSRPLQEVLGKSEKRSNTSETKDAQVGLEKAPGSTPQLSPRVGFVSRVRTIQPEADLLAERQRYMRGQKVHATEILQTPSFTDLTPEGDNQKSSSTDGHTLRENNQKSSSTDGHTLNGDSLKSSSTDDHTLRGGNQKFGSTDDHTLTGNNQKFGSTDDHTPNGDNQNPSSTDGHTPNGDNQKSSSTDGHTLNGDNQKSSSIDDCMLNVENQKVSFTDDHTQNRDNQASSSTDNENQNRGNQRSSPTHELTLNGDPQKSNFTNHRTLEIDDIQHKENVPHTCTDIQCKDKTLTRSPGSTMAISAIFHTSTEQMHSPTECVRNSNSQIPSKTLQDFGNTSHPLNEQVCERQEPISDLFISDAEGRSPVGNVYNSVHDKQYNKSSTSADTTQQHAQCDVLLPASSPEHPKSFSQSSIEDREAPLQESLAMSASHPLLLTQMPTDAKDHGISGDDHRNGARSSRSSKTYTKRNNDLVMHSKSAPASPCPLHAEVIKSKSKSERFYVEKVSSSGCLSSPSPSRTRRSRRHNETIEALCKQSISATLSPAVAESHLHETINATPTRTTHIQSDRLAKQDDAQLLPCNMETEATPSSPTPMETKKSTILDTKWLQKSKKFFKVSK